MRTFRVKMYAAARACFSVHSGIQKNRVPATLVVTTVLGTSKAGTSGDAGVATTDAVAVSTNNATTVADGTY